MDLKAILTCISILIIQLTLGYDLEIREPGYCKFQDATQSKYITLTIKSELNIFVGFFNQNERLYYYIIQEHGWKWTGSPITLVTTNLNSASFTTYWFSWYGSDVNFGLGTVPGTATLGSKSGVGDASSFRYIGFAITNPHNVTIRIPDSTLFVTVNEYKLVTDKLIQTVKVKSACAFKCLAVQFCYAFNFGRFVDTDNCELIRSRATGSVVVETPFWASPSPGWSYNIRS